MSHLIVLSGYSGSGKSTRAQDLAQTGCFALLRSDDYHHCYAEGMDVTGLMLRLAEAFGEAGVNVIVDAVNKHPGDRARWSAMAAAKFRSFDWIDLQVPIEECIRRDAQRPRPLGEALIRRQVMN